MIFDQDQNTIDQRSLCCRGSMCNPFGTSLPLDQPIDHFNIIIQQKKMIATKSFAIFSLFLLLSVLLSGDDVVVMAKKVAQQQQQPQQAPEVKQQQPPAQKAQTAATDQQPQEPQAAQQQCVKAPKIGKPKSAKALAEYELCKQECRRKRDQESVNEYVEYLREELRLAEERAEAEAQQRQQQAEGF